MTQNNANDSTKNTIYGVFSRESIAKIGTGATTRKTIQKGFWFANELEDGTIEVQPINKNYVPSGPKRVITRDDLLQGFRPEPEFYAAKVFPTIRDLQKTIARGERHRKNGETFTAAMEFDKALKVDEENIRANFGIGLCYLERGETEKANDIFERLYRLEAAFDKEHKHLFNEFGISMRKNKMSDQAVRYYQRAMELVTDDENLFYNVARAYYEMGEPSRAKECLRQSLSINPSFPEAAKFLEWLGRQDK